MSRIPVVDDRMVIAGSDTITVTTNDGVVGGWRLPANAEATVVEVNENNLMKLRAPDGTVSCWQQVHKYKFVDDPSRKKAAARQPRSGGKRSQLKAAERSKAEVPESRSASAPCPEELSSGEVSSPEVTPEQTERPSREDISCCISILNRLQPKDLEDPELSELVEVAGKLFRRKFFKDKFGSSEAVEFLKNRIDMDKKIKKLENLEQIVNGYRDTKKQAAENCGQNVARQENLDRINAEMALMDAERHEVKAIADITGEDAKVEDVSESTAEKSSASLPEVCVDVPQSLGPKGDYHHTCNGCGGSFKEMHHFYHQLCKGCAQLSWDKRSHTADMKGMICIVTGGRVRIGYQIVLKLLRAGAFVLTTTRFPMDCAQRFSREDDFSDWQERLEIVGLELTNMRLVELFCDQLIARFPRIHVLINNAAQTLTRPEGWHYRMGQLESNAEACLSQEARALTKSLVDFQRAAIQSDAMDVGGGGTMAASSSTCEQTTQETVASSSSSSAQNGRTSPEVSPQHVACSATTGHLQAREPMWSEVVDLKDFPKGKLDASGQPLDLTAKNSWDRKLCEVGTMELLQTLAANAAAPFIICSRLASALEPPTEADPYGHIVNVQALEGKFSVKKKSRCHPHTNMAKAALNMLTHTSANDLFSRRILMNNADTGWVTDMASGGVGPMAASHATFVNVPMDEIDGASRVLDPVFCHLNDPTWLIRGKLFKDYRVVNW